MCLIYEKYDSYLGGDQKALILKIRNADVTLSWEIGKAAVQ